MYPSLGILHPEENFCVQDPAPHGIASCRGREPRSLHLVLLAALCGDGVQGVLSPRGLALGQEAEHVGFQAALNQKAGGSEEAPWNELG